MSVPEDWKPDENAVAPFPYYNQHLSFIIMTFSLPGIPLNLAMILLFAVHPQLRQFGDIFVLSLCLANMGLSLCCFPQLVYLANRQLWTMGRSFCLVYLNSMALFILMAGLSIVTFSADRFFQVVCYKRYSREAQSARLAAAIVIGEWVVVFLVNGLPVWILEDTNPGRECHIPYDRSPSAMIFYSQLLIGLVVALVVVIYGTRFMLHLKYGAFRKSSRVTIPVLLSGASSEIYEPKLRSSLKVIVGSMTRAEQTCDPYTKQSGMPVPQTLTTDLQSSFRKNDDQQPGAADEASEGPAQPTQTGPTSIITVTPTEHQSFITGTSATNRPPLSIGHVTKLRRDLKLLVRLAVIFAVCVAPLIVVLVLRSVCVLAGEAATCPLTEGSPFFFMASWITMLHSTLSPIVLMCQHDMLKYHLVWVLWHCVKTIRKT